MDRHRRQTRLAAALRNWSRCGLRRCFESPIAAAEDIARRFAPLIERENIDFIFSFRYAKAHVYSSTTQPHHPDFVEDIGVLKTILYLTKRRRLSLSLGIDVAHYAEAVV
jgi:hypothetical protein